MRQEEWRDVVGYEGYYEVSDLGNVRGAVRRGCGGRNLKHFVGTTGYPTVALSVRCVVKFKRVHRLVAEAFIPNPDNLPEVNHINGDKTDFSIKNLEWCTHQQNMAHAARTGLRDLKDFAGKGGSARRKKVVRSDGAEFESLHAAAKASGCTVGNVCKVLKGVRRHAGGFSYKYGDDLP